jgi:hypothetical protein
VSGSINIPVVSKFDPTGIKQAQTALGGFGKAVAGIGVLVAGAFAIRAIGNFAAETVRMAEEVQQSEAVLRQVAETTGVFGTEVDAVTKRLIAFANAQELRIGVDSEVIKVVQAQLLTFKALGATAGEVGGFFDRATKAAFDIAMVLKKDASSGAIMLGKALQDPVKGMTALGKAGIQFTQQQKDQIKSLVESNRELDAQAIILGEVESQVQGAAEAGALYSDKFRLGLEQIKETIGIALIPAFERFVEHFLTNVVPPLTEFFEVKFPTLLREIGATFSALEPAFQQVGEVIREAFNIADENSLLEGLLINLEKLGKNESFLTFLQQIISGFAKLLPDLILLIPLTLQLAQQVVPLLLQVLPPLIWLVDKLASVFGSVNTELQDAFGNADSFQKQIIGLTDVITTNIPVLGAYNKMWQSIADSIMNAIRRLADYMTRVGGIPSGIKVPVPSTTGGRANGGRVTGGNPYLVGEMGPELFMPGRGGNIVPNDRLGSGGGANITINVNAGMGTDGARVGEQIVNAIKRYERTSGPVFASA